MLGLSRIRSSSAAYLSLGVVLGVAVLTVWEFRGGATAPEPQAQSARGSRDPETAGSTGPRHARSGSPSANRHEVLASVGPLKGTDLDGRLHRLGQSPQCRGIVVVFLATKCPISNAHLPALNRMAERFGAEGMEFYGVISETTVSRSEAVAHRDEYGIDFPVLFDASGELLSRLQPTHTPQAFVLTPEGDVLYSGRIDDRYVEVGRKKLEAQQHDLKRAVEAVAAGEPVPVAKTEPVGCLIETPDPDRAGGEVTFTREIAPIIYNNCMGCHRPGESAPFPLIRYEEVSQRARQIRQVTQSGFMPPWRPAPDFGEFRNERRLSDREIELLAEWAEAGAPRGDPADLPPKPEFAEGWRLGEPDRVYRLPEPFPIPADRSDVYQYFVIPTELQEDKIVEAIEFRPTNPRVVHHASLYYDTTGTARQLDQEDPGPGYERFGGPGFLPAGTLGGWAPGVTPRKLPEGIGRIIEAGADLVVQIHYHPTGKPETDQSVIGVHFAEQPAEKLVAEILVANFDLIIPPGERRHHHHASYTVPVDVTLHSAAPHMHYLGREMKVTAALPDGEIKPLIWIKDWDFNWQDRYIYKRPIHLPAGTRIDVEAWYDNSAGNPFNPNSPPVEVRWGERSADEMGICFFDVTTDRPEDRRFLYRHNQRYLYEQYRRLPWLRRWATPQRGLRR